MLDSYEGNEMEHAGADTSMRGRFREQVRQDVKAVALEQLAMDGPHAISLNAIAKKLGVSGSALYRYFAKRDDLLTALITDSYHDLRDALAFNFGAGGSGRDAQEQISGLARTYRTWALNQPHRYDLLFKPPLPGYDAHTAPLAEAARSLMAIVLSALQSLEVPDSAAPESGAYQNEDVLAARSADTASFQLAISVWSRLHGIVSLELGGGFNAMGLDADAIFENELQALLQRATPN